jgi:hypothetical protein
MCSLRLQLLAVATILGNVINQREFRFWKAGNEQAFGDKGGCFLICFSPIPVLIISLMTMPLPFLLRRIHQSST